MLFFKVNITIFFLIFFLFISSIAFFPIEELTKKTFFIEVEKKQHEAILQTRPLHDPENKITKS